MPFGKYKGKPLSEVPSSYIAWLQKGDYLLQPENKEIKAAIEAYQQLK
ncbi:DNA polymerase III subunit epsilon [Chlamydia trachomatis]|nr:DNA polymerase III subunit epsilon [Chlamydia trachomatis]